MTEENKEPLPREGPSPAEKAPITPGQQKRRQRSVFQYITILFAAALVLLLYTSLMERRQSQAQIDDLQQNANSATQRLDALIAERDALKEDNEALLADMDQLREQMDKMAQATAELDELYARTIRALDLFWQIDEAYVRGRTAQCRELIGSMEEQALTDALPMVSTTGNERFSPYDRYQEIRDAVM